MELCIGLLLSRESISPLPSVPPPNSGMSCSVAARVSNLLSRDTVPWPTFVCRTLMFLESKGWWFCRKPLHLGLFPWFSVQIMIWGRKRAQ